MPVDHGHSSIVGCRGSKRAMSPPHCSRQTWKQGLVEASIDAAGAAAVGGGGPDGLAPLLGAMLPRPTLPLGDRTCGKAEEDTGTAGGGPAGLVGAGPVVSSSPEELSNILLVAELEVSSSSSSASGPALAFGRELEARAAGRLRLYRVDMMHLRAADKVPEGLIPEQQCEKALC